MTTTTTYGGLPADTLPFLRDLRDGADREWFAANRDRYAAAYDRPAKGLVGALGERLPELSTDLHADPSVGGSIFRVNRDTRFRPDAGPYKDYIDLWFWEGDRALAPGGLYLRITPEVVRFGVGARTFSREALARFRSAVLDDEAGGALIDIVARLEGGVGDPAEGSVGASSSDRGAGSSGLASGAPSTASGVAVQGERLRSAPRGIDVTEADAARQRLLRHTALIVDVDEPAEALIGTPAIVDRAMHHWAHAWPLHRWLVAHVQPS